MLKGRLNVFQSAMLRWRAMHPYNAVHAVRIDAPLDLAKVEGAIAQELTLRGLGNLTLDATNHCFEYGGGEVKVVVRVLPGGDDPRGILNDEMARQLNAPFAPDGPIDPFRFFVVDAGTAFMLVLAYDHFVAGGDSIVLLMKAIVDRHEGRRTGAEAVPSLYPRGYRRSILRRPGGLLRGLPSLPVLTLSGRHSHRPPYPEGAAMDNGLVHCRLNAEEFAAVLRTAREWQVTLNDLLLAVMLLAVSPLSLKRRITRRRHYLAAASIINLRRDFASDARREFGQFLSSFQVVHLVPAGISLRDLAQDVHTQTADIKKRRLYLQALIGIWYSGLIWPLLSPAQRHYFHTKNFPVWVGMSMLNVDALWRDDGGQSPPPAYVRAVSTGPVSPLVVAATTAGNELEMGISYRTVLFDRATMDQIVTDSLGYLRGLAS
jgi:hypothetical protein